MKKTITIQEGNGGKYSQKLYEDVFVPYLGKQTFSEGDAATLRIGSDFLAYTADSFTIKPLFFPGGNIGTLAVNGIVNDLACSGAIPKYMTSCFIIEEGFSKDTLSEVVKSLAAEAEQCKIRIVAGDTKIMAARELDQLIISGSGIGMFHPNKPKGIEFLQQGDEILINGNIGDHGMSIFLARNPEILSGGEVKSDCSSIAEIAQKAMEISEGIKIMRDPTRGGLGTVLNEFIRGTAWGIEIFEESIPVSPEVRTLCEMFGFDVLHLANEGKLTAIVSPGDGQRIMEAWNQYSVGKNAQKIGNVTKEYPGKVVMNLKSGGRKIIDMLGYDMLPRIC